MQKQKRNRQQERAAGMALLVAYLALVIGMRLDGYIPPVRWTMLLMPVWLPVFSAIVLAALFFGLALVLMVIERIQRMVRGK